jgi:hypothetical protein
MQIEIWRQHVKGPTAFAEQNPDDEVVQDFDEQLVRADDTFGRRSRNLKRAIESFPCVGSD